jgi:CDGSH-type Zn-finger protein
MTTEIPAKKGSQKDARIQVSENGPYIVSGWIPLAKLTIRTDVEGYPASYVEGEEYPPNETYALCRCGQSQSKPFCDGTHEKKNVLTAPRSPAERLTSLESGKSTGQTSN